MACLGNTRSEVIEKYGMPKWWEGQPKLSCEQSFIWIYDKLQLLFDSDGRCVRLGVYFDSRDGQFDSTETYIYPFDDCEFGPTTSIHEFVDYLALNHIGFSQEKDGSDDTLIRIADGAVATFKHIVDFEKSVVHERRIKSKEKMLVSVVAGSAPS